jgi:streptogramin lyase
MQYSLGIVIDTVGNAWTSILLPITGNHTTGNVIEVSSTGAILSGSNGYPAGANVEPVSLAADGDGNVWATDGKTMVQFSQAGNIATSFTLPKSVGVSLLNLAIDGSGDLWAAGYTGLGGNVVKMTSSGTNLSGVGFSSGAFNNTNPDAIAFDSSGDLWMAGPDCGFPCSQFLPSPVVELSNSGVLFDGPTGYSVYGLSETTGLAIDGNGDVWIPNGETNSVSELSNTAANISNLIYTAGGAMQAPSEVAIDGSGNAWVTNSGNGTVTELVGAAAPVVTPLSVGVKNNMLGTRP